MGKLILRNNGLETQLVNGIPFSGITPQNNTYYIGVDSESGLFSQLNSSGTTINIGSGSGSITVESVTYSGLTSLITTSGLTLGSYYLINDFRTCYDQPDFDYDGNPIINTGVTGNYKQGPVEPILVFATSNETISSNTYQPTYPNDKITYDWTWNLTEVTGGQAFGRITERIDEYNNRTDYDHRNILFKRYKLFTYREELRLNGTIELLNDGTINGTNTSFTGLTVGDVIYIPNANPSYYEVVNISSDILMSVSGDTIGSTGTGANFYRTIEETNDLSGYFSYKRTNVKTNDYIEYTTFGNAFLDSYAKNNYVGNYANNYTNIASGVFLLANNVFLEGQYESNKFGDYSFNNTWGTDNQNNVWGDYCYGNVSTNDIDRCTFGNYFSNNLINVNLDRNQIGNDFINNKLLAENNDDFSGNIIGDGFGNNIIYSYFQDNKIGNYFEYNYIGDYGNLTDFGFYTNNLGDLFKSNYIRQDFSYNVIANYTTDNTISGNFYRNNIGSNFVNNRISYNFTDNNINNSFNYNTVGFYFVNNDIDNGFNNNKISNYSQNNKIGLNFSSNSPTNIDLFGWVDLTTVSVRSYDTFYNSLEGGLGNNILDTELVMRVISTSQYFKFKFTQWSQGGNGGGFQYRRTEIDTSGNPIGEEVIFTKRNYGSEIDVIIPGVLEITRGSNQGIYNIAVEGSWNSGGSPSDTEWNSIFTEPNNGEYFGNNKIANDFQNNTIGNYFGTGGGISEGNTIGDRFQYNQIGSVAYNNVIGNNFQNNTIGDNFENNQIKNYFISNIILDNFESNNIGDYFGNNVNGPGTPVQNFIGNDFKYNKIGNFFGNDANYPSIGAGTYGDGGNVINDGCQYNVFGDNVIFNLIDSQFTNNTIGNDFWFNAFGIDSKHNTLGNLFVGNTGVGGFGFVMGNNFLSNKIGNYAGFNIINADFTNNQIGDYFGNAGVSSTIGTQFNNNFIGNYFGNDGTSLAGGNTIDKGFDGNYMLSQFYDNTVGVGFVSNNVKTPISSIDFDQYRGNILTYTLTGSNGGVDGTYLNLTTTSNYGGVNATLDIVVFGGVVTSVTVNNVGQYYLATEILTVTGSQIGGVDGVDDVLVTVNTVVSPSVYEYYTSEIFSRQDGTFRLSYYDNSDVLNIKDIDL